MENASEDPNAPGALMLPPGEIERWVRDFHDERARSGGWPTIYVRKRDAFAVFCVAVIAAVAGHYFGTLANAPPDVAAIAEYVQEAPLFGTTADLLGDALAKARLATSVLRECLE